MPELGGIATSLIPAPLKILAMSIDLGPALRDPSLWKHLSADPSTNCSYTYTAATSDFMLSYALSNLVHHGLIFCQSMFSIQPLLSQDSRGRLVRFRGRKELRIPLHLLPEPVPSPTTVDGAAQVHR